MDAQTVWRHVIGRQILARSVLKAIGIPRRKADFDACGKANDDAIPACIVLGTLGAGAAQEFVTEGLGCLKLFGRQVIHDMSCKPAEAQAEVG
jgi:hypothetical protein